MLVKKGEKKLNECRVFTVSNFISIKIVKIQFSSEILLTESFAR